MSSARRRGVAARLAVIIVVVAAALAGSAGLALAQWTSPATGGAAARSDTMPAGPHPGATASGGAVTVTWAPATLPSGAPVSGYRVVRRDLAGDLAPTGAGCAGTVAATSCTEQGVPNGTWRYSVVPVLGSWTGAEGPQRELAVAVVTVRASTVAGFDGPVGTGTNGRLEVGDRLVLGFSGTVDARSVCSGWAPAAPTAVAPVTISLASGGTNQMTFTSTACTGWLRLGTVDLGASYVGNASNPVLTGAMTYDRPTATVTIQIGAVTSGSLQGGSSTVATSTLTWTPDGGILAADGSPVSGTASSTRRHF